MRGAPSHALCARGALAYALCEGRGRKSALPQVFGCRARAALACARAFAFSYTPRSRPCTKNDLQLGFVVSPRPSGAFPKGVCTRLGGFPIPRRKRQRRPRPLLPYECTSKPMKSVEQNCGQQPRDKIYVPSRGSKNPPLSSSICSDSRGNRWHMGRGDRPSCRLFVRFRVLRLPADRRARLVSCVRDSRD